MKTYFLALALLTIPAFAQNLPTERARNFLSMPSCYKGVQFSDRWMAANTQPRTLVIRDLQGKRADAQLRLDDELTDMHLEGDELYVLTLKEIEHWSLLTGSRLRKIATRPDAPASYPPYYSPRGFGFFGAHIYVAQERYGLGVIELASGRFVGELAPAGEAMDVTFSGTQGYVLSETVESSGNSILSAIFSFDPKTLAITQRTLLDGAPDGALELVGGEFYIGSRFYWTVDKSSVDSGQTIGAYKKLILPEQDSFGKPFIDEKSIYACDAFRRPVVVAR